MIATEPKRSMSIGRSAVRFAEWAGWLTFVDGDLVARFLAQAVHNARHAQDDEHSQSFGTGSRGEYRFRILSGGLVVTALIVVIGLIFGYFTVSGTTKIIGGVVALDFTLRFGLIWRWLGFLARVRLKPVGEPPADLKSAQYPELIRVHIPMLSMTSKELADRAGLFRWEAEFIMRNPDFIPRQAVQERVRKALMIGEAWPHGEYGEEYSKQRLLWYATKGYAGFTSLEVGEMTSETRTALLEMLERDLRERLDSDQAAKAKKGQVRLRSG